jgi:hypothetical protein
MELFYFIGAMILLAGLGVAMYLDRTRNRRKDAITEAATREQYHPKRYKRTQEQYEEAADRVDDEPR